MTPKPFVSDRTNRVLAVFSATVLIAATVFFAAVITLMVWEQIPTWAEFWVPDCAHKGEK